MALNNALTMLFERSATKGDCEYEVTEESGKHTAVVKISSLTTERTEFKGNPAKSEHDAVRNAAQKALNCLSKEINAARAKKDEEKASKHKEKVAAIKAKREEKKAEKTTPEAQ